MNFVSDPQKGVLSIYVRLKVIGMMIFYGTTLVIQRC